MDTYSLPIDRNFKTYPLFIEDLSSNENVLAKVRNGEVDELIENIEKSCINGFSNRLPMVDYLRDPAGRAQILQDCDTLRKNKNAKLIPLNTDTINLKRFCRERFQCLADFEKYNNEIHAASSVIGEVYESKIVKISNHKQTCGSLRKFCLSRRLALFIIEKLKIGGITSYEQFPQSDKEMSVFCKAFWETHKPEDISMNLFKQVFNEVLIRMLYESNKKKVSLWFWHKVMK